MSLNIYKPIDNPQHISILLPTRERPEYLKNVFDSLEEATQDKKSIDVWVYVDDDDTVTRRFIDTNSCKRYSFKIIWVVRERAESLGEMVNILREKCTANPGIYMPAADDYLFVTEHWDDIVREIFNSYPDRIAVAYPEDPIVGADQVTFSILSAEWTNVLGRFLTEYFPFWYDDSWLDQVAQMVQRKSKLDMRMEPQGEKGKTGRMRNLLFWEKFFRNTLDDRIQDAELLLKAIYLENSYDYKKSVAAATELAKGLKAEARKVDSKHTINMERALSAVPKNSRPDEAYLLMEARAIEHLWKKVDQLIKRGHITEALDILDNILCAYRYLKNVQYQRPILLGWVRDNWHKLRNKPVRLWPGAVWSRWAERQHRLADRAANKQGRYE